MKRIAVVEDEVYMREELCDMLQKDGYLVEAITEFEDAARLLAALRPDLVILDLNLPEISGFQICQELKNKTAIPVLVLTSRDQVKDELQAFQLGADEYLTKPCRKDRLLARVSNILMLWSSIFVTLMANKIGGLQFGIYRNCQISSRVFHTAVAALPLTKANRSDFE
jgi:DNA-binding response OmpR family regulator